EESLADQPIFTRLFDELHLACLVPRGRRCWWTDRPCSEFDPVLTPERFVLDRVAPFCAERWALAPRSIGLLGIGMGGQGVLRLAFKHPSTFPAVAAIAPAIECHELYGHGTP